MNRTKYPRTYHLPFSLGVTNDDKVIKDTSQFHGKEVVVTIKMDGENSTIYADGYHARSLDSAYHPSRAWLAKFQGEIGYLIPANMRVCGENMYARHSIAYRNLKSYFYGFSVWEGDTCLSWDDSLMYFQEFNITPVEVLYRGVYDEELIKGLFIPDGTMEGYVVRLADSFKYDDFIKSVAKFVRENHVTTDEHWMHSEIIPNELGEQNV